MCVRMFEPPEESSLGRLMVDLGVDTVRGSAGIVCRDAVTTLSIAFCLIHSGSDYIRKELEAVMPIL